MKRLCNDSVLRFVVVTAVLLSWFTITNHCALGLMKPTAQAKSAHAGCCSGESAPAKPAPGNGVRECCKSIHVELPGTVAVTFDVSSFHLDLPLPAHWNTVHLIGTRCENFMRDHGPPRSLTFAELVLQRSLLSHAPPVVV